MNLSGIKRTLRGWAPLDSLVHCPCTAFALLSQCASNWVDVTPIPAVTNQQYQVTVEISDGARFYRLEHP